MYIIAAQPASSTHQQAGELVPQSSISQFWYTRLVRSQSARSRCFMAGSPVAW